MRLIDADAIIPKGTRITPDNVDLATVIRFAPTVDAVPVVRCRECRLHGNCFAEDHFNFAGIENPFCCAGKLKEGAD